MIVSDQNLNDLNWQSEVIITDINYLRNTWEYAFVCSVIINVDLQLCLSFT